MKIFKFFNIIILSLNFFFSNSILTFDKTRYENDIETRIREYEIGYESILEVLLKYDSEITQKDVDNAIETIEKFKKNRKEDMQLKYVISKRILSVFLNLTNSFENSKVKKSRYINSTIEALKKVSELKLSASKKLSIFITYLAKEIQSINDNLTIE